MRLLAGVAIGVGASVVTARYWPIFIVWLFSRGDA